LKGKEIPLGARLFVVIDAFDAITTERPYRESKSFEEAQQEISQFSGIQFDPEIVYVFLKIPDETWKKTGGKNDIEKDILDALLSSYTSLFKLPKSTV